MEVLTGIIERVTFFNEQSGWSVLKVAPFQHPADLITVTIHQAKVFAGATVEFQGEWTEHAQYGTQFKANAYYEKKPASAAALEKYLGSGLIYGVGPKTAKKIVSHFQKDTLDIFEHDIERLTDVRGIARKKLEMISKSWTEHREIRNVMMFLQSHNISTLFAVRIYKTYGNDAISIVQENPYRLSRDIYGIGFLSSDRIAASLGIEGKDPRRVRAAIKHVLAASKDDGHCYLTFDQICDSLEKLLQLTDFSNIVSECLKEMEEEKEIKTRIIRKQQCYYSKTLFYDEKYVAQKARLLSQNDCPQNHERIQLWVEKFNKRQKHPLSQEQIKSVMRVVGERFSILTGGPGCGKTTTTKAIVQLLIAMGKQVLLAAPTGRAAQRMEEVIGLPSQTIHRLLVWNPSQGRFKKNEEDTLESDFIIIDECSMLDISLTASLLRAINPHQTQVLFIGDHDQLPSVGAGNVLKDLISSEKIAVFKLTEVFRQSKKSLIIEYAHQINRGEIPHIDSPFRDPSLWKKHCDVLFIDSEEATLQGMRFLQKAKRVLNTQIVHEGVGFIGREEVLQKISQEKDKYLIEDITAEELKQLKEKKYQHKIFSVPEKFQHVQIEKLLESSSKAQEIKEIFKKIHPYSSLHYGITASNMILKLYQEVLFKYWGEKLELQVLTPMTKGSMGTLALNKKIQEHYNREAPNKKQLLSGQKIFRQGDRVIQKRNNYDLEVFNGDIGYIVDIDLSSQQVVISFSGKKNTLVTYKKENLIELDLAYAITIHKSQGSEFDAVIIPLATQHFKLLFKNLLYTGLTRAKKLVVFVGTRKALAMAVKNVDNKKRQTFLRELVTSNDLH